MHKLLKEIDGKIEMLKYERRTLVQELTRTALNEVYDTFKDGDRLELEVYAGNEETSILQGTYCDYYNGCIFIEHMDEYKNYNFDLSLNLYNGSEENSRFLGMVYSIKVNGNDIINLL